MKIPTIFQPYVELFQAIDGHGQLWSPSGQFLGRLCSDIHKSNSIINPDGEYGSPYSLTSIHNRECEYGGETGEYSPFNPNSKNPPIVFYRCQPLFIITTHLDLYTNGLKLIDPYLMLTLYEVLSSLIPKPAPNSSPTLIRSSASVEELQAKLRPLNGSAFYASPSLSSQLT